MKSKRTFAQITAAAGLVALLSGCQILPAVSSAAFGAGAAASDVQQTPEANQYTYRINGGFDQAYNAALMSASNMGRVTFQDRAAGMIQFQSGNWVINAVLTRVGKQTNAALTFRYLSSSNFDFSSKKGLSEQFNKGIVSAGLSVVPNDQIAATKAANALH